MAAKKNIALTRGNSTSDDFKNYVPADGQPVYDKTNNKLYIGDGTHKIASTTDASDKLSDIQVTHSDNASEANKILDAESLTYINIRIVDSYPSNPVANTLYLVEL